MKKYQIIGSIGSGTYGQVHKVKCINTGRIYAMKQLKYNKQILIKRIPNFNRQLQSLQVLSHPNIVQFIETFENQDEKICIVMDFCSKKDLTDYLSKSKTKLTDKDKLQLFGQIIEGMYYIHNQNYMHRDLKPDNIMINEEGIPKIGDFGMIKKYQNNITHTIAGTPLYASPQILDKTGIYSKKCDVFSLGLILFFIVFKSDLFQQARKMPQLLRLQQQMKPGNLQKFVQNLQCAEEFKKIFLVTLCYQQKDRYSMQELRDWFVKTIKPKPTFVKSQQMILSSINSFFSKIYKQVNVYNDFIGVLKQLQSDKSVKIKTIKRYSFIFLISSFLIIEYSKLTENIQQQKLQDNDFNEIKEKWINRIDSKSKEFVKMNEKVISQIASKKGHKYLQENVQIQKMVERYSSNKYPKDNLCYKQVLKKLLTQEKNSVQLLRDQIKIEFFSKIEQMI